MTRRGLEREWWIVCGLIAGGIVVAGGYYLTRVSPAEAHAQEPGTETETAPPRGSEVRVEVVRPKKGGMDRSTVQTGTVQSYESAQLFAEVSGYLKTQTVDIGDRVKRGQVVATIDVPELEKQVQRNEAVVKQATARVHQMNARVASAKADRDAALAAVTQAQANAKSAEAWKRFREKQLSRMQDLFALKSIDERLVDETQERFEAAMESVRSAHASVATANAQVAATDAKIEQARADILEAEAQVEIARADVERAQVLVRFATITSPYDGIITQRSLFLGDFVRSATGSSAQGPLLTVERTDRMRVIVQIPDRDVPYADPGDAAVVEIDALPGKKFAAKISRIAGSEDPQTRLMRVEIDLPNPTGKIRQGMYGRVTILLERSAELLSVPSSCLVGKAEFGKGAVYVVRNGRARLTPVELGADDGLQVGVVQGLKGDDQVIHHPPANLPDGAAVTFENSAGRNQGRAGH